MRTRCGAACPATLSWTQMQVCRLLLLLLQLLPGLEGQLQLSVGCAAAITAVMSVMSLGDRCAPDCSARPLRVPAVAGPEPAGASQEHSHTAAGPLRWVCCSRHRRLCRAGPRQSSARRAAVTSPQVALYPVQHVDPQFRQHAVLQLALVQEGQPCSASGNPPRNQIWSPTHGFCSPGLQARQRPADFIKTSSPVMTSHNSLSRPVCETQHTGRARQLARGRSPRHVQRLLSGGRGRMP